MSSDELRIAALALPSADRAKLAQELLRSLDEPAGADSETAWLSEITRRAGEVADGSVQSVDWEVARERIARRLHDRRNAAQDSSRR
jgi:putative addiction module component (TIGR02574 family)